jgi:hypothetical protein
MPRIKGTKRTERLILLYTVEEWQRLKKHYSRSSSKTISRYVRRVSLEEPVEIVVRNASFDEFVEEIIELRGEMAFVRQLGLGAQMGESLIRLQESIQLKINKIVELCMQT